MTAIDPVAVALTVPSILGIIKVQRERLDRAWLADGAQVLGVEELLARALDQAGE